MNKRYLEKRFLPGETLVARGNLHWSIFLKTLKYILLALLFLSCFFYLHKHPELWPVEDGYFGFIILKIIKYVLLFFGAKNLLFALTILVDNIYALFGDDFVLTNKRLIVKEGLLHVKMTEIMLDKIEGLSMSQPVLGRWLGYGTIHITTGGVEQLHPNIKDVVKFHNTILEKKEEYKNETAMKTAEMSSSQTIQNLLGVIAQKMNNQNQALREGEAMDGYLAPVYEQTEGDSN